MNPDTLLARYCRCCLSSQLVPWLNLGDQPLANSYHASGEPLPAYPLLVNVCEQCAHSQLSVVVPPANLYQHYLYVSGTTETFRQHQHDLAVDVMARCQTPHPYVLDIACNDGSQLEAFRSLGARVLGVDPAQNLRAITKAKEIPVLVEYWGRTAAVHSGGHFDWITATNVFAHVHDPNCFLKACKQALAPGGRLLIEFPYAATGWREGQFDQVYHEHLSYFLVKSFTRLVERHDWQVEDVVTTAIHGGSIRFILSPWERQNPITAPVHPKVAQLLKEEQLLGLHDYPFYRQLAGQIRGTGAELRAAIQARRSAGRTVVGYGASAKGNTALNAFQLSLDYIVDDNPLKWGLLTPGRDIPIAPPETLAGERGPLTVVVLAWNFAAEIARKVRALRGDQETELLFYVPDVHAQQPEAFLA